MYNIIYTYECFLLVKCRPSLMIRMMYRSVLAIANFDLNVGRWCNCFYGVYTVLQSNQSINQSISLIYFIRWYFFVWTPVSFHFNKKPRHITRCRLFCGIGYHNFVRVYYYYYYYYHSSFSHAHVHCGYIRFNSIRDWDSFLQWHALCNEIVRIPKGNYGQLS